MTSQTEGPQSHGGLPARISEFGAEPTPGYDDAPWWGVSQTVALALAALDLDVVHRATLRALLPAGRTRKPRRASSKPGAASLRRVNGLDAGSKYLIERGMATGFAPIEQIRNKSKNQMSEKFQRALKGFEDRGWLVRGEEYVLVRNRRALLDWATAAACPDWLVFPLGDAIDQINEDLKLARAMTPKALEQRRQELLAIKRLMEEGFGDNWSGRGSVRLVPKSRPL